MTAGEGYFLHPHIHGDLLAFVAEDDVWLAPAAGGRAWRISADQTQASTPRFSPDGALIAWTSTRDGAPEVHIAPVDGGPARRLTYWGSDNTSVLGWTPDGEVLALSSVGRMSRAHPWAFAVPLDGGPARELPYGRIGGAAAEPGGDRVLLVTRNNREPAHWKRYRGGRAGRLWLGVEGDFARVHQELDGNIDSPMWVGDRIAFLSDHEGGVAQLWSSLPDGSQLRRHSEHAFYARNAATDGGRVVYHSGGDLWLVDDLDGAEPRRAEIRLGGPRTDRQPYPVTAARHLGAVAPDQDGRSSVVEVRGTIHRVTHRDGPARVLSAAPGVRNRLPQALPDGASVWVTDADGEDALEFSDGRRVAVGQFSRVEELAASPDGTRIALANRDGMVLLVEDGEIRELDRSGHVHASGLAFSPDSRWLAWSRAVSVENSPRQLRLADLADGTVTDLTPPRFNDHAPVFTTDGRHLAFLSLRDFDPVYDEHVFDLSFPLACRPYLMTLAADTLSPFGPQPLGRAPGRADAEDTGDDDGQAAVTRIDLHGLADRVVPFPVPAGRYSSLRAVKGGVVWLDSPLGGRAGRATPESESARPSLERFDFAARRAETLVDALSRFAVSGDGTRLAVVDRGELRIVPADRKASKDNPDDSVGVDLGRVRVTVDPAAEWRQMFDETARLMRDNFWRTDMGGLDWAAVQARYRPLVERVGSYNDLVDLLWELQGETGTSHSYVQPVGGGASGSRQLGLLGADLVREGGSWRIARVLPGESSDPRARSPLAAPGANLRPGDAVTAVDGRPVDPVAGPAPLLVGAAGRPVELTVAPADGGPERAVVVVPLADEEPLRYHDWVAGRRAYVRERSGGALGYLHVPDMQGNGWAQLHRDLRQEMARDGLIVDTRENRGGHTSQLIIEKLSRRIVGWDRVRDFPTAYSYPAYAPRGPLVAVADEFSGSDGDIVNAAFQALRLGPVVGVRTWGGVIGIDGRYSLVDGTGVTQPRFAFWMEGYGWGLENHGVDPDVEVVCAPQDWAAGRDPQLDEAIRIALAELAEHPAAAPPAVPGL
ncbi:peptidase S41 [Streptacidiphilus sp. PB12-B1b]|uniref:S41 family peptidase n=1 Tax=Streptacidiphilus sp. PB12-B1b TaxID=2705012 RepID=UPI0015FD98F7|nr:S41 family peptidase [Streptacidiphilus sp. PB12-B1b]QMU75581.1 peptidase S41 [Streptacidiphilus sp. PB12-B1b]